MRITKIEVKGLFGVFDHEIPLNQDEHITIIHGPNGYGKTILLTLVNAIFNSQYHKLLIIPYKELILRFHNYSFLSIKTVQDKETVVIEYQHSGSKPKSFSICPLRPDNLPLKPSVIEKQVLGLERLGSDKWLYNPTRETIAFEQVLERFGEVLPEINYQNPDIPGWFKKIKESIDLNLIVNQRLLKNISSLSTGPEYYTLPTVLEFSKELAGAIKDKLTEYGTLSQSLDRSFPARLVNGDGASLPALNELKEELKKLDEKRERLIKTGFLEKESISSPMDLQKIDENNKKVISVYIKDTKQKLDVFDPLAERIELFLRIVNNTFLYKELLIDKQKGFEFKTPEGKILSPTCLSSGEQHELVLLYELLFKVSPDSLILIDEPELSLHVAWQQQFLKDLKEITDLVGFDTLIATHSPQIIHDRWDLTVELKGPQD